jgi:mRNA interferase HigB
MRVIAIKTLKEYIAEFHQAEQALLSWHEEAVAALWNTPNELKAQYKNASVLNERRVVSTFTAIHTVLLWILNTV